MANILDQLTWNIRIVTPDGRPTDEFMRKWSQAVGAVGNIIDANTAAEVSAILDKIGGNPGDILVRGTEVWGSRASPSDATQFLNGAASPTYAQVKDSDLSTSDITTNNASDSKHGFLPKLSGVATEYLDGSGNWSTPAGGGGGGGGSGTSEVLVRPAALFNAPDGGSYATLTNALILAEDTDVSALTASFECPSNGTTYAMFVAEVNSSGAIQSTLGTTESIEFDAGNQSARFDFATDLTIPADTPIIIALVITSATTTTSCGAMYGSSSRGYPSMFMASSAMDDTLGAYTKRFWYAQNSSAPSSGSASGSSTSDVNYDLGFVIAGSSSGGGGGGGSSYQLTAAPTASTAYTYSHATKGSVFTPQVDIDLHAVWVGVRPQSSGVTVQAHILEVSAWEPSSLGDLVASSEVVDLSDIYAVIAGWDTTVRLPFASDVSLTAYELYFMCVTRTDGTATSQIYVLQTGADYALQTGYLSFGVNRYSDTIAPANGDSLAATSNEYHRLAFGYEWILP